MDTKKLGNLGERIACEYLVNKGYEILDKNHRTNFGEIDIIARKKQKFFAFGDKTIHFIEVKTIMGEENIFFPEDKVNYKKRKKLRQLAEVWLERNKFLHGYPYQIDVIGILVNENAKKAKIRYFPDAIWDERNKFMV